MDTQSEEKMKKVGNENPPLLNYFNIKDGVHVIWAHAVNNKTYLDKVLSDPKVMMLEADVIMHPLKNIPIMAHPPAVSSDIDLKEWLITCHSTNKGLKLDFKQSSAVLKSQETVLRFIADDQKLLKCDSNSSSRMSGNIRRPIILNADVLLGPNANPLSLPVDPKVFFDTFRHMLNVTLSPGWVTTFKSDGEGYSWNNVKEMYDLVKDFEQHVTFPVRASLAGRSAEQLIWLLQQNLNRFSLTIWTSKKDKYNLKELLYLREFKQQVYFDLPESEISELLSLSDTPQVRSDTQPQCVVT